MADEAVVFVHGWGGSFVETWQKPGWEALLNDVHRRVIVLKYFDGLEVDELCAALGCSRQTFAVKLHRALRALRVAVHQEAIDAA